MGRSHHQDRKITDAYGDYGDYDDYDAYDQIAGLTSLAAMDPTLRWPPRRRTHPVGTAFAIH